MAQFPRIDSSCPFRADETPQPGRDHCGHCDRQVHNLDGMSDERRRAFLAGCSGKVCVAYTVHRSAQRRNLALGASLAASLLGSGAALAQSAPATQGATATPSADADDTVRILTPEEIDALTRGIDITSVSGPLQAPASPLGETRFVMVGGILDPAGARWADESDLASDGEPLPEIAALEWLPSKPAP